MLMNQRLGCTQKEMEKLVVDLHKVYNSYKNRGYERDLGKYKTPNPTMIFSTHSPNIVKMGY